MNKVIIIVGKPAPDKEDWPNNWGNDNFCFEYKKVYFIKIEDQDYINKIKDKVNCNRENEFCIAMHCDDDEKVSAVRNIFSSTPNSSYHIYCYSTGDSTRFGPVKTLIDAVKNNSWEDAFDKLWDHCVKTDEKKKVNEILHLFLPLDIDMQALSDTKVDKEKYLKQMQEESPDYLRSLPDKLKEIQEKIGTLDIKGADGERLKELIGLDKKNSEKSPIYKFLESLGTAMKYDVIKFDCLNTLFSENKKENDINQFNKWYRELAGELKKLMPISETERY